MRGGAGGELKGGVQEPGQSFWKKIGMRKIGGTIIREKLEKDPTRRGPPTEGWRRIQSRTRIPPGRGYGRT